MTFHQHYQRPLHFIVAEDSDTLCGFLPLCWIEESNTFGYFPGETWEGKTWLEQNRIFARDRSVLEALLEHCPAPYHIRYLLPVECLPAEEHIIDEIGYLFVPASYAYEIDGYFGQFSGKSAKRLRREIGALEALGVEYRYDDLADYEHLVRMNLERFGEKSYYADPRFTESFRTLMHYLHRRGWLRMTTVVLQGQVAAVDMGCVYRGVYTLLAGGTHGAFPGVAKLINLLHMKHACQQRLQEADFLCGDFSWKKLFHLTPRPLYLLSNAPCMTHHENQATAGSTAHVD